MEDIIEYTYNWIKAMSSGKELDGHGFFSGFPQPYKKKLPKEAINALYYALSLIDIYDKEKDLSYYDFFRG